MSVVATVLQALVLVFVVGPLLAWLKLRARKERGTSSIERFTVKTPSVYRTVLLVAAPVFEALMTAVYLMAGAQSGEFDVGYLCLGHVAAAFSLVGFAVMTLQKLEVDGDTLTYRSALGRTRSMSFSALTSVSVTSGKQAMRVYADGKRLATLSHDMQGVSNLLRRCERDGVPCEAREQAPMTVWRLYRSAVAVGLGIGVGVSAFLLVLVAVLVAVGSAPMGLLLATPVLCALLIVSIVAILSIPAVRGIAQLKRQERVLGFSFNRDMAARGARGVALRDDEWFVAVSPTRIVAFRRDYVKKVTRAKSTDEGHRCTVTAVDGTQHAVYANDDVLGDLRTWFNEGEESASAAKGDAARGAKGRGASA